VRITEISANSLFGVLGTSEQRMQTTMLAQAGA
jgi:hypothetical protein